MKQSEFHSIILAKRKDIGYEGNSLPSVAVISSYEKFEKTMYNQITEWDLTEALEERNRDEYEKFKVREADQKTKADNKRKRESTTLDPADYSEENWENLQKGRPFRLIQIYMPKRLNSRNSFDIYGRKFYVVKKNHDGSMTKTYRAFDIKTRIYIAGHANKKTLEKLLIKLILEKEEEIDEQAKAYDNV
jgi:hypothetical protein